MAFLPFSNQFLIKFGLQIGEKHLIQVKPSPHKKALVKNEIELLCRDATECSGGLHSSLAKITVHGGLIFFTSMFPEHHRVNFRGILVEF